jgi:integrase
MPIVVRPYRKRGKVEPRSFEYDISFELPDGSQLRERRRAPTRTETQTREFAEKRLSVLIREGLESKSPLLSEFWPLFLAHCQGDRLKPNTLRNYQAHYRRYLAVLGSLQIARIGGAQVAQIKAQLSELGAGTVNGTLVTLHRILAVAFELGAMRQAPPKFKYLPNASAEILPYTEPEQARLLAAVKHTRERAFLLLGLDAGLRASEIAALRREDLDMPAGFLLVRHNLSDGQEATPKSKKSERQIFLTSRLKASLVEQLKTHAAPRVLFWGGLLDRSTVARWLSQLERRAGLPNVHCMSPVHRLRHSFASRLASRGATAKEIAELLGHASLRMAERYIHLNASDRPRAIALLEDGWSPAGATAL